jgi:hypothetical protein
MRKLLLVMSLLIAAIGAAAPSAAADTGAESTGADQFPSGTNVTPAMVAASSIVHCTGYVFLIGYYVNGHELSTKANTCGVYYGRRSNGQYSWGPVVRFKCYRDGVQFGAGTGGCRWKGSLTFDLIGSDWLTSLAWAVPGSQSSAFWDDSGRIYGSAYLFWSFQVLQVCEDDYIWEHLGQPAGNGVVHFMGITGIDYGTFNMANKCTGTFRADDTS